MSGFRRILLAWSAAQVASLLLLGLVARSPRLVEQAWLPNVGTPLSAVLGWPASWLDASLAEVIVLVACTATAGAVVGLLRRTWTVRTAAMWILAIAVTLANVFYASWGLAYGRSDLAVRAGWVDSLADAQPPSHDELQQLALSLVRHVNVLYVQLHGATDGLVATDPGMPIATLDTALSEAYSRLARRDALLFGADEQHGLPAAKPLRSSALFSRLHISGIYFPFTREPHVNVQTPAWQLPHTVAHEMAHQRHIASEAEANFMGFMACALSDNPAVQYSGWLFAQRQVLRALRRVDPEGFDAIVRMRHPGVQRDVWTAWAFWRGLDGPLATMGSSINHVYLRANRVPGGVASYGRSLMLLVHFVRARGHEFGLHLTSPNP